MLVSHYFLNANMMLWMSAHLPVENLPLDNFVRDSLALWLEQAVLPQQA